MYAPVDLATKIRTGEILQESHWLEWKSAADLNERLWQARAARFILGAANRSPALAQADQDGRAFLVLGVAPGSAPGTPEVDAAVVDNGLRRYLGSVGPPYTLQFVTVGAVVVAFVVVQATPAGNRPYVARGTLDQTGPVIRDGRIYIRRAGATEEATSAEIDEMLIERLAVRRAAGPRWPLRALEAWRDGRTVFVRQERGDAISVVGPGTPTLAEVARERPELPADVPSSVTRSVDGWIDPLLVFAETDPVDAVEDAWPFLREIAESAYCTHVDPEPRSKVIDMVDELAGAGVIQVGWVGVVYTLYYWPTELEGSELLITSGDAKSYLHLTAALATALLACQTPGGGISTVSTRPGDG